MGRKSRAKRERRNLSPEERQAMLQASVEKKRTPRGKPIPVNDTTFDSVVGNSELPVLVDFWASWCGPCKMIAPVLEQIAAEMKDELRIVKYNTEENKRVAAALNIRSLPSLVLFRDGEVVDVQIGAVPAARLRTWLTKRLAPKKPSLLSRLWSGSDRPDAAPETSTGS